jgi:5'-methylthioadenosine phosphorylase
VHQIETPFGRPSADIVESDIDGQSVFFLPRHGVGHRYLPSEIPARANVYALKTLGVDHLVAVSAVGIMREDIRPGDIVVPDQIFDRTRGFRPSTFFGDGIVGHVGFADPYCAELSRLTFAAARDCGARAHSGGTYVCMEGPQFSTRAESRYYRSAVDATVIGMTALPEAKLAREAEMCYATVALATDYDCWHESEEDVTVDAVVAVMKANSALAQNIIRKLAATMPADRSCPCHEAARFAIMTSRDAISDAARERLRGLYGKYWASSAT